MDLIIIVTAIAVILGFISGWQEDYFPENIVFMIISGGSFGLVVFVITYIVTALIDYLLQCA